MCLKVLSYLLLIFTLSSSLSTSTLASTQTLYPFTSPDDQKRFEQLINQTRCLVCKNQTIAESHTSLAKDLRQKIYEHIKKGYSDEAIQSYLINRYGDFILFEPLFKPITYLLWLTPFILLFLALGYLFYLLYKRQRK